MNVPSCSGSTTNYSRAFRDGAGDEELQQLDYPEARDSTVVAGFVEEYSALCTHGFNDIQYAAPSAIVTSERFMCHILDAVSIASLAARFASSMDTYESSATDSFTKAQGVQGAPNPRCLTRVLSYMHLFSLFSLVDQELVHRNVKFILQVSINKKLNQSQNISPHRACS